MSGTTRAARTRRLPAGLRRYGVTVIGPSGDVARLVRCRDRSEALQVVEHEAERAELWTLILVSRLGADGKIERVGTWAVGPRGLGRARPRRK